VTFTLLFAEFRNNLQISSRLKVIEELSARCSSQEEQLQKQGSFHAERRQYEERISRLQSELDDANANLKANTETNREKESTISEIKVRLAGMSRTKDMINGCLAEASGSIKAALALQASECTFKCDPNRYNACDVLNLISGQRCC
jgi:chromosome segregation ATPase